MHTRPKSYMTDEERGRCRAGGLSENGILLSESKAAGDAGDEDTAWAWLALAELPAYSLSFLKGQYGAQFIRQRGFPTKNADAAYGRSWLDRA